MEILRAAKETIALAEERLLEEDTRQFDSAWQEMLNHATQRVRRKCGRAAQEREPPLKSPPLWMSSGDGGGASQNTQRGRTQENGGQLQRLHQPHEAAGEETEALHQQIQVGASL